MEAAELESRRTRKHAGCSAWLLLLCLQGEQLKGGGCVRIRNEDGGERGKDGEMEVSGRGGRPEEECDGVNVKVVEWPCESGAAVATKTNGQRLGGLKGQKQL